MTSSSVKLQIILGSTRPNRYSEKLAVWLHDLARETGHDAELVDLRDYPLPFFNEVMSPAFYGDNYPSEAIETWSKKIAEADGYLVVSPEYNHGYSAILKNALDYGYKQWNRKAIGFAGYGGVGGARAIEQLRLVAIELQLAPVRDAVHVPLPVYMATMGEAVPVKPELFEPIKPFAEKLLSELAWWSAALKTARQADAAKLSAAA